MDISGLTSAYSDLYSKTVSPSTSKLEGQLNSDYSGKTDEELMDVCKQFEAYFLEQMLKEMVKTIPTTESSSASMSTLTDYYKDEMIRNLAEESTEHNSLGLAQMLYEQMRRNYGLDSEVVDTLPEGKE